jgi:hypothetical protein
MKISSTKNFFQPRARLLLQLGDKLIKNENIALLELIKNSYDADARHVNVKFQVITDKKQGIIDIVDDGEGMDMTTIENVWLEPGSDHKAQLFNQKIRTKKYKRLPIGEKGIGRFGVHKLGNKIELISRKEGCNEVVVKIDWNDFAKNKYLKDAKVEVIERTPEYFLRSRKGTRIIISDLRTSWDRRMIRDLYKSVFTLNSPFQKSGNFFIDLDLDDKSLVEDLPKWEDIQKFSLWHFKCKLKGNSIVDFLYEFKPWDSMSDLSSRTITAADDFIHDNSTIVVNDRDDPKSEIVIDLDKQYEIDGEKKTIGEVEFEGYIFDRERATLGLWENQNTKLFEQYLNEQGGLRVYRDNVRINEYGEKGNDWLSLDIRRVNVPTKRISNNLILGVVDLKGEQSTALIEKTNREGFIENEAFYDFCSALLYTLNLIETLRKIDKDAIRTKYNPTEKEEPVLHHLGELKELIEKRIDDVSLKVEINAHLVKIEEDYNFINEVLLASAGAGLTLGVGVHEVQKVITELNLAIEREKVPEKILSLVKHLDKLIENYSDLLRQSDNKEEDVIKLITGALFNEEYRLESHGITVLRQYLKFNGNSKVKCSKRLLLGSIMNLLDNSIYWLDRKRRKLLETNEAFEKKIIIDIINGPDNTLEILICDNGLGFSLPTYQLTKPFISSKPNGMGLGLHIVNEVMKSQGGRVIFPEQADYDLPADFKQGALVLLQLNRS